MAAGSRSSVLLGSETPRLWTKPRRELTPQTSRGFECIRFADEVLGLDLNPWQRWFLVHVLELNPDGTFRFRTALLLVARQSGKTLLLQVLALWFLYVDDAPLILGTAQDLSMSEQAWEATLELAESLEELREELLPPVRVNGQKAMRLRSGPRYEVKAATRRAGRGKSTRAVFMDELREHQSWDAWGALSKTTMAQRTSLVLGFSNAGDVRSVVLRSLRDRALERVEDPATTLGIFEWSAPDGCALDDPAGWAAANPSLGYTMQADAIEAALDTDPEAVFRTEVLCQWVDDLDEPVIPRRVWDACADPESKLVGPFVAAVDINPARDHAAVAVCGRRADGLLHLELVAATDYVVDGVELSGIGWVESVLANLGASSVHGDEWAMAGIGFEVEKVTPAKMTQACGAFFDAVVRGDVRHRDQGPLNAALSGARRRELSAAWAWDRKTPSTDITPLVAATVALWAATSEPAYDPMANIF